MTTNILVFTDNDLKVDGKLKKKNNTKQMPKDQFLKYVADKNLSASYGYIDLIGTLSNGEKFRAYHNNMVIGVSGIVKELNGVAR